MRTKVDKVSYFWSLKLFPKGVRDDISKLHSFVHIVHSYVDQLNPDLSKFKYLLKKWKASKKSLGIGTMREGDSAEDLAVKDIAYVVHRYSIDPSLVDAFLESMQMDLGHTSLNTMDDIQEYAHGSSEALGIIVSKIVGLPTEAYELAKLQARAFQQIYFISELAKSTELGRQYFSKDEIALFGLKNLSEKEITRKPAEFREFMQFQVTRYFQWQKEADKVFRFIPKRTRIAIRSAVDMYTWSAKKIYDDPMIVFKDKALPNRVRMAHTRIMRRIHS